ncbi:chorismate-binding protein [Tamlana fucoidanivorans]|uniref:Isochorismate synthase n=1 Tax=Allotamlana fucoidanivorans TaxID=2583814 RepID=A0A5C4SS74_9FLAO|nr:chorismate-binding protein [Tamlana fucoidanivorans]TNJ46403.1 isochorismate synthase [Tamlana fucoidanivorans]
MNLGKFFQKVENHFGNQLPFVMYRKPKQTKVFGRFQNTSDLHCTSDFSESGFVFSPFNAQEQTVLIPSSCSDFEEVDLEFNEHIAFDEHHMYENQFERKQHIHLVNQGIKAIKSTSLKKVVLSRKETKHLDEFNLITTFKKLLKTYNAAFVYCWFHPKVGLWLGATPETLLKIEGKNFSMMALAGTQEYQGTLEVEWQNKEKKEQQYVTDYIVDNLKSVTDSIKLSDVETVKAGHLVHLKTMVSARLKDNIPLQSIINTIHPTPAVCGVPKEVAKTFILQNEHYKREFYTGFLGELNAHIILAPKGRVRNIENRAYAMTKKSTQLYVNLRCMQIQENQATIYVGGGITENSNAEKEWQETVAKSLVIKKAL